MQQATTTTHTGFLFVETRKRSFVRSSKSRKDISYCFDAGMGEELDPRSEKTWA
jgi:hypothetical protein